MFARYRSHFLRAAWSSEIVLKMVDERYGDVTSTKHNGSVSRVASQFSISARHA